MAALFHARLSASAISAIFPSFGRCATIARLCAFMKGGKSVNFELSRMVTSARFPKRSRSDGSPVRRRPIGFPGLGLAGRSARSSCAPAQRLKEFVGSLQRFRRPLRAGDWLARQVHARFKSPTPRAPRRWTPGSCAQDGASQAVAGIVVDEKNRCLSTDATQTPRGAVAETILRAGRDSFGDNLENVRPTVKRDLVYT
jgi:hypothetical protein